MTTHTQDPWRRGGKKELRLSVVEMEKLGVSLVFPQHRDAEAEANSRRVVAALNACAGVSTENLEDNKPIIELANDYNAVLKQRDMLLDVLRKTADDIAYVAYNIDGSKLDDLKAGLSESTCPSETALIAERNCREAISRVKGGAE